MAIRPDFINLLILLDTKFYSLSYYYYYYFWLKSASPIERPRIIFTRRTYSLGERVQLKCISGIILPAAQLRWYISNVAVPESNESVSWMLNVYDCQTINHWPDRLNKLKPDLSSSLNDTGQSPLKHVKICKISILSFILADEHLSKGSNHFTVRCVSTIQTGTFFGSKPGAGRPIGNRGRCSIWFLFQSTKTIMMWFWPSSNENCIFKSKFKTSKQMGRTTTTTSKKIIFNT